jgi:hypothetical protein
MGFKKHINIKVIRRIQPFSNTKSTYQISTIKGRSHYAYLWNIFKKHGVLTEKTSFPMRPDLSALTVQSVEYSITLLSGCGGI